MILPVLVRTTLALPFFLVDPKGLVFPVIPEDPDLLSPPWPDLVAPSPPFVLLDPEALERVLLHL